LGLSKLGTNYKGFLYAGLMIVKDEPYLIEYNVRMGDPECQTILPKLQTNLTDILLACCDQTLDKIEINWSDKKSICIVVCSKGYPDEFEKNIEIENLDNIKLDINENLFHAGTTKKDNKIYATGGRVLNFVSISDNFTIAKKNIIKNLDKLNWTGGFYRKDIGYKVID
jgi:phosphoribosylamine--glycine ligase